MLKTHFVPALPNLTRMVEFMCSCIRILSKNDTTDWSILTNTHKKQSKMATINIFCIKTDKDIMHRYIIHHCVQYLKSRLHSSPVMAI